MRILGMNRKVPRHTRTHIGILQSHLPETLSIRNVSLKNQCNKMAKSLYVKILMP
jgi:hypothetical protein